MKEELIKLKELIKEYNGLFNTFSNKKTLFNLRVNDLCEQYNYKIKYFNISEEEINKLDSYSKAKSFFSSWDNVVKVLNNVRKNSLENDRNKLISLYIKALNKYFGYDYQTAYFFANNYYIYVESGYYKTKNSELLCEDILRKISVQTCKLKENGISSVDSMLGDLKLKLRPYAGDAKNSFSKVKKVAQPVVHYGSKTLAKVFNKLADVTKKK